MKRLRTIAAAPVRSATEAWQVLKSVIVDTLQRSPAISEGSVDRELAVLDGIVPALIAGGHFEQKGFVLHDTSFHITFLVVTADPALYVEENLNPIPGGASATEDWVLYIPLCGTFDELVEAKVQSSSHLTVQQPPEPVTGRMKHEKAEIDFNTLRDVRIRW